MAQHYWIVNMSRREYIRPEAFGDGMTLMEFGPSASGVMMGLAALLCGSPHPDLTGDLASRHPVVGSWAADRIVVAGDYERPGLFVPRLSGSTGLLEKYRTAALGSPAHMLELTRRGIAIVTHTPTLRELARVCYTDISDRVIQALCDDPYERNALIARGVEAAKSWVSPLPAGDPDLFRLD